MDSPYTHEGKGMEKKLGSNSPNGKSKFLSKMDSPYTHEGKGIEKKLGSNSPNGKSSSIVIQGSDTETRKETAPDEPINPKSKTDPIEMSVGSVTGFVSPNESTPKGAHGLASNSNDSRLQRRFNEVVKCSPSSAKDKPILTITGNAPVQRYVLSRRATTNLKWHILDCSLKGPPMARKAGFYGANAGVTEKSRKSWESNRRMPVSKKVVLDRKFFGESSKDVSNLLKSKELRSEIHGEDGLSKTTIEIEQPRNEKADGLQNAKNEMERPKDDIADGLQKAHIRAEQPPPHIPKREIDDRDKMLNTQSNTEEPLHTVCIGTARDKCDKKTILLLGPSKSGKSTLVRFIASCYMNIDVIDQDLLRTKLSVIDENMEKNGSDVTAYVFYPDEEEKEAITVIDTPGLNDTKDGAVDNYIKTLNSFLNKMVAQNESVHAIGFVIQSHVSRMTTSEKVILDMVTKWVQGNFSSIIPLVTFADQKNPPVTRVLEKYSLDVRQLCIFNNSVLCVDENQEITPVDELIWKRGIRQWRKLTKLIKPMKPITFVVKRCQKERDQANDSDIPQELCQNKGRNGEDISVKQEICPSEEKEMWNKSDIKEEIYQNKRENNICDKEEICQNRGEIEKIHDKQEICETEDKREENRSNTQLELCQKRDDDDDDKRQKRDDDDDDDKRQKRDDDDDKQNVQNVQNENTKSEDITIRELRETVERFVMMLDEVGNRNITEELKDLREAVWQEAKNAYFYTRCTLESGEEWLYCFVKDVCLNRNCHFHPDYYLKVLSLAKSKKLVHLGCGILMNAKLNDDFLSGMINMPRWTDFLIGKMYMDLRSNSLRDIRKTISVILMNEKVHHIMTTNDFLYMINLETGGRFSDIISNIPKM